ncbi:MAG: PEP-CTERM sorting domain-containing protein [Burkholderiales bacterium]|nr:PEP-CTERM sorting domain-containing protein [Burkholderiales bacterium]
MTGRSVARTLLATTLVAASFTVAAPASAITTTLYDFIVTKNGAPFFLDSFVDGLAPPSAPDFANATAASYRVGGTFPAGSESAGQLTVSSLNGLVTTNALGERGLAQRATLITNNDPTNTVNGLKPNHIFTVSALVDVASATGPGSFGVRLSDRQANPLGVWSVSSFAAVELVPSTQVVRLRVQDFIDSRIDNLSSIAVPAGVDQVRLALSHPTGGNAQVFATAEFFDDGESLGVFNLPGSASIFTHFGFTRAEFAAGETLPIPEPETYAMMLVGLGLIGWQLRRKARSARARSLV